MPTLRRAVPPVQAVARQYDWDLLGFAHCQGRSFGPLARSFADRTRGKKRPAPSGSPPRISNGSPLGVLRPHRNKTGAASHTRETLESKGTLLPLALRLPP